MKNFFILISFLTLSSCATFTKGTLNRDYSKNVSTFSSNLTLEESWSKLIDYFSERGIGIQTMDKASGLIVSKDYSFNGKITIEERNGENYEFKDKDAWAVCNCDIIDDGTTKTILYPTSPYDLGNFNVRIKNENDKTKISINLISFRLSRKGVSPSLSGNLVPYEVPYQAYSTGVFEKLLIDYVDPKAQKL